MTDADILSRAHMEHLWAVQSILGPNIALGASLPIRARGPRRRYDGGDRKLKQVQRRLRTLARAADFAGQPDLSALVLETIKEAEEE